MEIQCPAATDGVLSLHFSDNGEFLAGICTYELLIWRVVDGVQVTSISGTGRRRSCAWLRQSLNYLTLSVVEWGIHEAPRSAYLSVTKVHMLHSGTVTTSEPISLLPDHISAPHIPTPLDDIFANGLHITQSLSGVWVAAWNTAEPGCYVWQMVDSTPAYMRHRLSYGRPHSGPSCARFLGDTHLAIGLDDGTILWWDISTSPLSTAEPCGFLALFPEGSPVHHLSVSPLHSLLVTWCYAAKSVSVLRRTKTGTSQGCLGDDFSLHVILRGHTAWVTAAYISPCERYIATTSLDCTVRLWSTRDGELLWTFHDYETPVSHLVFASDGKSLASADYDGRVRIRLLATYVRDVPLAVSSVDNT